MAHDEQGNEVSESPQALSAAERAELEQLRAEKAALERRELEQLREERNRAQQQRSVDGLSTQEAQPKPLRATGAAAEISPVQKHATADDELRRIAEARARGHKLMQPDEDSLAMPPGQKIVLIVIALAALIALILMLVPFR